MKQPTDIYEALDWLSERIMMQRIVELTGHSQPWLVYKRMHVGNFTQRRFVEADLPLMQKCWDELASRISTLSFLHNQNGEGQTANWLIVKEVFPSIFFQRILGCDRNYFVNHIRVKNKCRWKDDEIVRMNAAIMATYNYMKNVELVIPD